MEDLKIDETQKKRIDEMSDSELLQIISKQDEYQPTFVYYVKEVAIKRNLINDEFEKSNLKLEWFYESKGNRIGPVDVEEIKNKYKNDFINDNTLVWKKGFSDWKKIREIEIFEKVETSTPPPLSGNKVNNFFIWLLVFAPILGTIITSIFSITSSFISAMIFASINSIFAGLDEKKLKTAGYNSNNLVWAIFLVPVYLWKRSNITKQSKSYFWVWFVVIFVIAIISVSIEESAKISINNLTTNEQTLPEKTTQPNVFKMNEEVTFNNLFSIQAVDIIDPYTVYDIEFSPKKGNKFVAVEIIFKNISVSGYNYSLDEYKIVDNKGYSYEYTFQSICSSKKPSFDEGTLSPNSFRRGWITFETLKDASDFKLHYQKLYDNYYTDIMLKK